MKVSRIGNKKFVKKEKYSFDQRIIGTIEVGYCRRSGFGRTGSSGRDTWSARDRMEDGGSERGEGGGREEGDGFDFRASPSSGLSSDRCCVD
ncbi:hypothetical protein HZH66_008708 [Vespula vulgaris]|uniref:Uncharacterized protein n=1 Tax=Vespula vulgaris TaxID=7454 RepID=A0A834JRN6_VESVU|nr:hypothetical protein HZH66_008708 [Vespula vulgaris]